MRLRPLSLVLDKILNDITQTQFRVLMTRSFHQLPVEVSINAFLIDTGTRVVLVDTGAGDLFASRGGGGRLLANLRAAGYQPDQINDVLLTHVHADHSGGLVIDEKMVFPNALVHVHQAELDYWFDTQAEASAPSHQQHSFPQGPADTTRIGFGRRGGNDTWLPQRTFRFRGSAMFGIRERSMSGCR